MKRTLMIFGMVGSLFLASCGGDNDREEYGYTEPETTENRYDTDDPMFEDDIYSDEFTGTTVTETDNTVTTGVGTNEGLASNSRNGNIYVCTDSTLVSDIGY